MTLLRESYLFHLWLALCSVYEGSAIHRMLAAAGRLVQPPDRREPRPAAPVPEGVVARAWAGTAACAVC